MRNAMSLRSSKQAPQHSPDLPKRRFDASLKTKGLRTKICRIMRITAFILLTCCLHVSASTFSQTVTLSGTDLSLKAIFAEVKKQTGYVVFTGKDLLLDTRTVSMAVKDMPLRDFLELILKGQPMDYKLVDQTIILVKKNSSTASLSATILPPVDISGQVIGVNGALLSGASVRIKGTVEGKMTNAAGRFSIKISEGDELIISFVGYLEVVTKMVNGSLISIKGGKVIAGSNGFIIRMTPSETSLQEVVVNKGYYSTSQHLNTGNVTKITGDNINKQPIADPIQALQGQVPGLFIQQSSGVPGSSPTVRLRGQNSIASGNDPLYIVDGVPFNSQTLTLLYGATSNLSPFSTIAMTDIESVDILKDADATAIYGSRGANGVILITTRKGKAGKTKVDLNVSQGFSKVNRFLPLMNTQQYLAMRREAFANDNAMPGPTDYDLNGAWDTTRYTDWQKFIIGNTSRLFNAQVSVSGGNTQTQFLVGGGYRRETTIFPGDFNDKKISGHASITHTSENQRFRLQFTNSFMRNINDVPRTDFQLSFLRMAPNGPALYTENGELNWENDTWDNPLGQLQQTATSTTENLVSSMTLSYMLLPGLQLQTTAGYNSQQMVQVFLTPFSSVRPSYIAFANSIRAHERGDSKVSTWNIEPQLNYSRMIGLGKLDALVGVTFQQRKTEAISINVRNFPNDAAIENITAGLERDLGSYNFKNVSYFHNAVWGRLNYNLFDKYLFNATARRDGSSRFGPGKRFGNFGAIGAAWIFSQEPFVRNNIPFLSYGKLRGSFGTTGLEKSSDYEYLSTYSYYNSPYLGSIGLYPTQLTNPDYAWEVNKKTEGGLELGFAKDRILLSGTYYRNRTRNQLVGYPLPGITGFTSVLFNLPAVVQNTGLELELNTLNIQSKSLTWRTSINISFPRNKLVSYPNIEGSPYARRYKVGESLFVLYYMKWTGVDPQTGLFTYEDLNGDNTPSYPDDYQFFTGGGYQQYYGGITNSFSWKEFQLNFLVTYAKKNNYRFNHGIPGGFAGGSQANQPVWVLSRWQKPGDISEYQPFIQGWSGPHANAAINTLNSTNYNLVDASYLRLRNAMLSYTLPEKWRRSLQLDGASIYVQGQNLFVLTNYQGVDPEVTGSIPPLRNFTFGLQITL